MSSIRSVNLALAFLLELAMLAAFAYWGAHAGGTTLAKVALAVGIPAVVAGLWGAIMAPNSPRRLQGGPYLTLKVILFGLAVAALFAAGQPVFGILLGALFVPNTILLEVLK